MAKPSKFQKDFWQALFDLSQGKTVGDGKRNILLDAKAGSGKTFSIKWGIKYIPKLQRVIALMFNKRNAEDMQVGLREMNLTHADGITYHSLGSRALRRAGAGKLNDNKMRAIFKDLQMTFQERQVMPQVRQLVGIAKAAGLVPEGTRGAFGLIPDSAETWNGFIDHYAIEFAEPWQEETAISFARLGLKLSLEMGHREIDYDDMLYLPVVMKLPFPKYDWLFIDEAQDISAIQREMTRRALAPNGHVVAVGDENQAIYGFRGASTDSLELIKQEFDCHVMPLSICYRCDKNIIREAKKTVPAIEFQDSKDDGIVSYAIEGNTREEKLAKLSPESVILCPFNAPLVETALALIRNKIACHMVGRNFAEGLIKLLDKLQAITVAEADRALDNYEREEYSRLIEKDQENKAQALQDKCDALRAFLDDAAPNDTVERIKTVIESLFNEAAQGMLTLSSVHKAKGGQWPRVFFMEAGVLAGKSVKRNGKVRDLLPWEVQQKRNLLYVGVTRAEHELILCSKDEIVDLLR